MTEPSPVEFFARYAAKDLILYALAIGFGSSTEQADKELRFLYENHDDFTAVPTFVLALQFWAAKNRSCGGGNSYGIQQFPPPMMRQMGVVPKFCMRSKLPIELPVLHTWQSITWQRPLPMPSLGIKKEQFDLPVETKLQGRFISVVPKAVGTFVTNETSIFWEKNKPSNSEKIGIEEERICTLRSTALVLGLRDGVTPYQATENLPPPHKRSEIPTDRSPDYEWSYETTSVQALLYRVASGDSNSIHVDTSASVALGATEAKPLLHGLCTLGFVMRAIINFFSEKYSNIFVQHIECKFAKPVWVGDKLSVKLWKMQIPLEMEDEFSTNILMFTVHNHDTDDIVVDQGVAELLVLSEVSPNTGYTLKSKI
mmetsp:Transcript_3550/g.5451  ORF Transcript_3550/g.5451 Transcript_3550/m.5451 type:complete len:370 (-) Transcript_3550:989-2098(-)|eukprot:CAMPEP_0195295252 /NCGR_PEP_ID=MMETSP0707-20130614/16933_1 /TAXON_ID=33640 /ORGANISM="Asterionellopsis glacialis, Strain CCMP134" /LENGTH=369 /DNA_ID=CAMNT_0040356429 /DNA_START=277 /DNA_END=1386 /DNA_ORIENTATION=-